MKRIPVIVLGAGGVGRALLGQIVASRSRVSNRACCQFDVVAVADGQNWLWQPRGFNDDLLLKTIAIKKQSLTLDHSSLPVEATSKSPSGLEILDCAKAEGLARAIVVDVTAADGMEQVIDRALELGYSVAMANKKALAGPWTTAKKYYHHPRIRYESTVGGGQPVIATLRYLLDVNDPVYQIAGQLSGTLGFICSCLDRDMPFSRAIADARAKGYTEPDPREDLGGRDVMRKVLILARMAGWPLEEDDIEVSSLYPQAMASLSVAEFISASAELDADMRQRVDEVRGNGQVLRYVAEVEEGGGFVGLKSLPGSSPLADLKYISFRTARYDDEPLLIGGKGAGVEMTAAGVLGDMINLVRETIDA